MNKRSRERFLLTSSSTFPLSFGTTRCTVHSPHVPSHSLSFYRPERAKEHVSADNAPVQRDSSFVSARARYKTEWDGTRADPIPYLQLETRLPAPLPTPPFPRGRSRWRSITLDDRARRTFHARGTRTETRGVRIMWSSRVSKLVELYVTRGDSRRAGMLQPFIRVIIHLKYRW